MRDRWSSRTIFLFAAIGSAVGLGNIWRFPYLTYKFGGGAFLIPYLLALSILGIPLLMLEFALGQKIQKGAIGSFKAIHKRLGGIGFMALASGFIVVTYYAVIMAWSLIFFIKSFSLKLPWAADSKAYFFDNILNISESINTIGGINWPILFALLVVWIVIYFCVFKGVKSAGKVVMVTMPLPIILLIVLFTRGITLDGALTGIYYYLKPDFAALLSSEIWIAASAQIFFTLSVGFGIMIAYASYNKQNQNITGDTFITAIINSVISIFAGFVVFSIIGYMAFSTGANIADVATQGPGLAFVVFPQALSLMPVGWLFAALFFLTLLSLGIDSAFSLVEGVDTAISDRWKKFQKKKIAFFVCLIAFLIGILFTTNAGLYFLDIVDHFITNFGLVLVGLFECIAVGWILGAKNLRDYINKVSKFKIGLWWDISIKYIIPLILIVLIILQFITEITTNYEGYPGWALAVGWAFVVIPLLISIWMAVKKPEKEIRTV